MTKEESQIRVEKLIEKLGDKYTKNGIEYYIKNVMPHPKENQPDETIILVHLVSNSITNFIVEDYDDFILQYQPVL